VSINLWTTRTSFQISATREFLLRLAPRREPAFSATRDSRRSSRASATRPTLRVRGSTLSSCSMFLAAHAELEPKRHPSRRAGPTGSELARPDRSAVNQELEWSMRLGHGQWDTPERLRSMCPPTALHQAQGDSASPPPLGMVSRPRSAYQNA
jgi:hypothetical protein